MNWWLKDFDLLSVVLRALVLALEALTVGGVLFLLLAGRGVGAATGARLRTSLRWSAVSLALAVAASTTLGTSLLVGGSGLPLASVAWANFFVAGEWGTAAALLLAFALRWQASPPARASWAVLAAAVMGSSVALSHAASRLEGRLPLLLLTVAHHLGTALWIGAMPWLAMALRRLALEGRLEEAARVARGYSRMALVGLPLLVAAGVGLSWVYVGSWAGLYGSSYGVMIMAKTYLLLLAGWLGWANQRLLTLPGETLGSLLRVRRFSEVEIGLGFTAVLAAASLTSQAPAADLPRADLVSAQAIAERFHPVAPRLTSPPLKDLTPPTSIAEAIAAAPYSSGSNSDANDRAWSEYNHHWAGLVVLAAAALALVHRAVRAGGARLDGVRRVTEGWPLLGLGLAVFVLLRADPENWPLGPRPFWASFSSPDVLEHRLYAVLIASFALFEWAVERGRGDGAAWRAYVFPLVCAVGGAALLTHSHAAGDPHEELLAELSHTPIAVLGATAGWGRWLELRLPGSKAARWAGYLWPACLVLAGLALLDYRES